VNLDAVMKKKTHEECRGKEERRDSADGRGVCLGGVGKKGDLSVGLGQGETPTGTTAEEKTTHELEKKEIDREETGKINLRGF